MDLTLEWVRMPGSPDRPTVSIILPTYNRAAFLPQAFASIRSQTFTDWELIVIDDGSTDNTPALVEELTRRLVAAGPLPSSRKPRSIRSPQHRA